MPKNPEFLRLNTVKEYINTVLKMRSSEGAAKKFIAEFDSAIEATLADAGRLAKERKRNTILDEDIIPALEKHLGKKHLTWEETADEIIRQNPTDLGKISKAIYDYIEKEKEKNLKRRRARS
jgi:histone H3/H4